MRRLIIILLVLSTNFNGLYAQSVVTKYKMEFEKFDSLNNLASEKSLEILNDLRKTKDFQKNDSLKGMVFHSYGNYYVLRKKVDSAVSNYDKAQQFYINLKWFKKATTSAHNKAVAYQQNNQIDTSIVLEEKAMELAKRANDDEQLYISIIANARKYQYKGDFEKSNQLLFSIIDKIKNIESKGTLHGTIATNFDQLGILDKAEYHYLLSIFYIKKTKNINILWKSYANFSDFYNANGNYEKSLKYADSIILTSKIDEALSYYYLNQSTAYKGLKNWDKALYFINKTIEQDEMMGVDYYLASNYKDRGQIYFDMKNYKQAFEDFKKARSMFKDLEDVVQEKQLLRDYVSTYLAINNKEIWNDFEKFIVLNDSLNKQSLDNNILELDTKYRTAEKEAQIKTQQLQLEKEKYNKTLLISALGVLLTLSAGGYFWNRNRQKRLALQNQNELLKLQQNFNQLELQNLNQQLDPHEVKNLLASISPEIQEKAPDAYQKMLKLFKLTRATLNNKSMTESLEIQLQQIEDYLSLEKTMLNQPLHFNIDNQIIEKEVQIPRLLLKNLVENAIKHGIRNKIGEGHIQISTIEKDYNYHIIVDDDGVGRKQSVILDTGLGTGTYQNLFAILNQKNKSKADFEIIDKEQGTKVVVKIPVDYKYV